MMWIRLVAAIIIFVTSCVSLGYLAGLWARRHNWPGWVRGLLSVAIAFLWPVIVVGYVIYDARRYSAQHPYDDAPGMVVMSVIGTGAPLLFVFSLALALVGVSLASRRNSTGGRFQ